MLIKESQAPYISNKIMLDLLNSSFVTFDKPMESAIKRAEEILLENIKAEREIEEEVKEIIEEQEEDNEYLLIDVDRRELFGMIKKKICEEDDFIIDKRDRLNNLAHKIIDVLWDEEYIDYEISDGKLVILVVNSINNFLKQQRKIEDNIYDKIRNYKRKLIPGSEEFEIVKTKLYEEELKKRGML